MPFIWLSLKRCGWSNVECVQLFCCSLDKINIGWVTWGHSFSGWCGLIVHVRMDEMKCLSSRVHTEVDAISVCFPHLLLVTIY